MSIMSPLAPIGSGKLLQTGSTGSKKEKKVGLLCEGCEAILVVCLPFYGHYFWVLYQMDT